jgi:hypothetical protein
LRGWDRWAGETVGRGSGGWWCVSGTGEAFSVKDGGGDVVSPGEHNATASREAGSLGNVCVGTKVGEGARSLFVWIYSRARERPMVGRVKGCLGRLRCLVVRRARRDVAD